MTDNANAQKRTRMTESELSARYSAAQARFAQKLTWREHLELAEEFHELDTYKESPQLYTRCIKAAAAPAYHEIIEHLTTAEQLTAEDYYEAARVMGIIQDYRDARENVRIFTIRGNVLCYEEAVALLTDAEATTEELGRGIERLRSIKTFRDSRALLERFEKYYFERMYADGMLLMENGRVYSEFEEAAAIFEKIPTYSDAAAQAAACRKRAAKLRPKKKKPEKPAKPTPASGGDETARIKSGKPAEETDPEVLSRPRRKRIDDETRNAVSEVLRSMDKRRVAVFIVWVVILVLDVYASIVLPGLEHEFFQKYSDETRGITAMIAIVAIIMGGRAFVRMLTASMRRKLGQAALNMLKKLAAPLIKAFNNLLMSIGIDLSRHGRIEGRDERSFVFHEEEKAKKTKKRFKNDLKWQDQTDNAARVRFIFIDYMIRRIRSGYIMRRSMTPAEIGLEVATEEDEQKLFAAYDKARYAGRNADGEITDALVTELRAVNQKRD